MILHISLVQSIHEFVNVSLQMFNGDGMEHSI